MKQIMMVLIVLGGLASTATQAGDLFERKAGLWKITIQGSSAASTRTVEQCLAADTDALLARKELATTTALCSKFEAHRTGNTFITDAMCKAGNHTSSSHTVTTAVNDGAYHTVVTTHDENATASGKTNKVFTHEGHWAGACPATMQPGDQILHVGPQMPNGIKTNLLQAPSLAR